MTTTDPAFICYALTAGYLLGIAVETPFLLLGLSKTHPLKRKLLSGIWLTACTYPFVAVVIPCFIDPVSQQILYKSVAEVFAPAAECALFWFAYHNRGKFFKGQLCRDCAAIVVANLASFGAGELITMVMKAA